MKSQVTPCFNEQWKDIPEFEGVYQVSNKGRVRSLTRKVRHFRDFTQTREGQIIKPETMPNGYLMVTLHNDGINKSVYVHRLVAVNFIGNPKNLSEVNHKDEDKTNNLITNLEWCDHLYNIRYGKTREKIGNTRKLKGYGCKEVSQYTTDGVFIRKFKSAQEAMEVTGIDASAITKCRLNRPKFKTAGGFVWRAEQ